MRVLALDTATEVTAAALLDTETGAALALRDVPPPGARPRHTTALLGQVVALLERSGAGWAGVDRLAVGVGPGTFTGLRIGIATARALSGARGIPLAGVSTLASLALAAGMDGAVTAGTPVLALIDARRGEVFAAAWRWDGERLGEPLLAAHPARPEALADAVDALPEAPVAIGSGAVLFPQLLRDAGAHVPDTASELHVVTAVAHCRLAAAGPAGPAARVLPEYLRRPDAELALGDGPSTNP